MNKDSFFLGIVLGFMVPILGILIFYTVKYLPENIGLGDFIFMVKSTHYIIPKIISLGLIACIPLITYYKNRRCYQTLKGVFVMIILYVILALLYKFNIL